MGTVAVYLDESGIQKDRPSYCVIGGQLGSAADWGQFTDDWNAVRNRPEFGGKVYHAGDVWRKRKDFKDWEIPQRVDFSLRLADVLDQWKGRIFTFAYSVEIAMYERIFHPTMKSISPHTVDPYFMCLSLSIMACLSICERRFPGSGLVFFADQQHEYEWRGRELYKIIRTMLRDKGTMLDEELSYRSKEKLAPLQSADMVAHHCFLDLSRGSDDHPEIVKARGRINTILNTCSLESIQLLGEPVLRMLLEGMHGEWRRMLEDNERGNED